MDHYACCIIYNGLAYIGRLTGGSEIESIVGKGSDWGKWVVGRENIEVQLNIIITITPPCLMNVI